MHAAPSEPKALRRALLLALVSVALIAVAGCGSDEESDGAGAPAPSAAAFPEPDGQSVEEIFAAAAPSEDIVVSPSGQVFNEGTNRFGFGVFTAGREQINDADVAIYAGRPGKPAKGPFPARIEDMTTDPAFTAITTATDPDAAKTVYAADLELDALGRWDLVALVDDGETVHSTRIPSIDVGAFDEVPVAGEKAPVIETPTADDVSNLDEIDTRDPHSTQHEENFADVVGEKPVVLTFATPLLCQSRVCGPVVDVAEQVKADHAGEEITFIHQEIFEDNDINKGLREQVRAYGLPTEPWVFVIGADGEISTAIEGAFSVAELDAAVDKVAH
ncbi:MAG: hypothetical protein ACR2OC_02805 [Solirubrobacterales bacterium]